MTRREGAASRNLPAPGGQRAAETPEERAQAWLGSLLGYLLGTQARRYAVAVVIVLVLVSLGIWTHVGVKESLRAIRASELETVLDAEVKALQVWIEEKKLDAERWANDDRVRAHIAQLVEIGRSGPPAASRLCESPARAALNRLLEPFWKGEGSAAFNAIDRSGLIVATQFDEYCGMRVRRDGFLTHLKEVFEGKARFLRPFTEQERLAAPAASRFSRRIVWVEAPVRDAGGEVIAALGFGEYAYARFGSILSVARPGRTGEAYAFDAEGLMVSESRFARELEQVGFLPGDPAARATFHLPLRDPGGDVAGGHRPEAEPGARPLTRLAETALAAIGGNPREAHHGIILDPYRNYRGLEVIGAWRWLPDFGIGVALEVGAREAYAPLRYLNVTFTVVFALLVVAAGIAFFASSSVVEMRWVWAAKRLGQYRLLQPLGEGGMAKVYMARHKLLRRPVAIKVLKPHMTSDEVIARFEREVQLASQLSHPNTIEIYDYGRTRDGVFYYVMEYLQGITLAELAAFDRQVPPGRVAHILMQICAALREAHGMGIIHRDIKPENVMLCQLGAEDDVVKVLDFGIVKKLHGPDTRDITRQVKILGTPAYMAPERLKDPKDVDARSDIYAVGAVGFFLLTGRRVFEADNDEDMSNQILYAPPKRPSEVADATIPRPLDELIVQCLAKDRNQRPAGTAAMIAALDPIVKYNPWTRAEAAAWWQRYRESLDSATRERLEAFLRAKL